MEIGKIMSDIKKAEMKSLDYDQLLNLKNIVSKKNGGRLDLVKNFFKNRDIPFKSGHWRFWKILVAGVGFEPTTFRL